MSTNDTFSNRGHILASVGAAVGIANLVLFPARVFNYGGLAFILVFVLCTFALGIPLMMGETALGRNSQTDAVKAFSNIGGKYWGYAGKFGIVTCSFILSFYIVVAGWSLYYLYTYIFDYESIQLAVNGALLKDLPSKAGIGGFFGQFVTSGPKVLLFSGIFMAATIAIIANNINKGIEWVGKRFVPLLIVLLVYLIIATPFMDGTSLNYSNFKFDFGALFSIDQSGRIGIIEAVGQSFFSLSLGACGMLTYGVHVSKKTNILTNSHYIVHTDTLVALLGGLLIIPLFSSDASVGLDPTLVFISLVDTFNGFGEPWGRIIGIAFFALFNLAIITSTISLLEPAVNYFTKNKGGQRPKYAVLVGLGIFVISIPAVLSFNPENSSIFTNFLGYGNRGDGTMGYFNFILDFFGTFCLLAGAFILAIFIRKKWTIQGFFNEVELNGFILSEKKKRALSFSLQWLIPGLMLVLFIGEVVKILFKLGVIGA
jgi:NSS family neurotransmitter:Na+ symporter